MKFPSLNKKYLIAGSVCAVIICGGAYGIFSVISGAKPPAKQAPLAVNPPVSIQPPAGDKGASDDGPERKQGDLAPTQSSSSASTPVDPTKTAAPVTSSTSTITGANSAKPSVASADKPDSKNEVAAPKTPEWKGPTLGDLEKIRSENAILTEQLKNAELKKKIAEQGGGGISTPGPVSAEPVGSPSKAHPPPSAMVTMIAGAENNYQANILLPGGRTIAVKVGSNVPGQGAVSQITPNEVIFGSGKTAHSLMLSSINAD